jgi:hypothetical protein
MWAASANRPDEKKQMPDAVTLKKKNLPDAVGVCGCHSSLFHFNPNYSTKKLTPEYFTQGSKRLLVVQIISALNIEI